MIEELYFLITLILLMYNFIETFKMPLEVCDIIIKLYDDNLKDVEEGVLGADKRIDHTQKQSKDLTLGCDSFDKCGDYYKLLDKFTGEYIDRFQKVHNMKQGLGPLEYRENGVIQKYPKGGGFKRIHYERGTPRHMARELVYMTYLTNTPNAGTHFPYQETTTECIKGDTIIWPASHTHPHVGIVSETHEKMIITGWISYDFGNYLPIMGIG